MAAVVVVGRGGASCAGLVCWCVCAVPLEAEARAMAVAALDCQCCCWCCISPHELIGTAAMQQHELAWFHSLPMPLVTDAALCSLSSVSYLTAQEGLQGHQRTCCTTPHSIQPSTTPNTPLHTTPHHAAPLHNPPTHPPSTKSNTITHTQQRTATHHTMSHNV